MKLKEEIKDFGWFGLIADIFAIVLGIAITFYVQKIIDDKNTEEDVKSTLQFVEDELKGCKEDFVGCAEKMDREQSGAKYFLLNKDNLANCPEDSVYQYGMVLINPSVLTISHEAIDALRSSSLFHAIEDSELRISILRAYEVCNVMRDIYNDHENSKVNLIYKACKTEDISESDERADMLDFVQMMQDRDSRAVLVTLRMSSSKTLTMGLPYLDEAIERIEKYIKK